MNKIFKWPKLLFAFIFFICLSFHCQPVYATEINESTPTPSTPIQILIINEHEKEIYNSEENISFDDLIDSYQLLKKKLQNNQKKKEEAQTIYKKKQEEIKKNKALEKKRDDIVKTALTKKGCPYIWGATGPKSFDCSGLTQWCYKQNGIYIPRVAADQAQYGKKIEKNQLKKGDLIFFRTEKNSKRISHVGMYIGNGLMIHSPHTGDVVKIVSIHTSSWQRKYAWACRYIF